MSLLNTLKDTLMADVPPTVWACLWLCDIDKLKEQVDMAKMDPLGRNGFYISIESTARIVQKCGFVTSVYSYSVDLLILYRDPTRARAFCRFNSSATIYSTGATFPNSTIYRTATI